MEPKKTRVLDIAAVSAAVILGLSLLASVLNQTVQGQSPGLQLIYGQNSGTFVPLALTSGGYTRIDTTEPCQTPSVAKSQAVISITVDTAVVAAVASTAVHLCSVSLAIAGTTPSIRFQSGTGSACATSTDQLSGVMLPTAGSIYALGGGPAIVKGSTSEDLCIDVGGTPSIMGVITYINW